MTTGIVSAIPPWHRFLRHVLIAVEDGDIHPKRDLERRAIASAHLSTAHQAETLPSGQSRALNRIGWATSALRRAKAIEAPSRAHFRITETGRVLLSRHSDVISVADLEKIPAFSEYVPTRGLKRTLEEPNDAALEAQTPQDLIELGVGRLEDDVKSRLLDRLRGSDPLFFEQVVRQVLVRMGYGSEVELSRLPGSGDGGLDGKINRDELGLGTIYVQAKRYAEEKAVGRPAVQGFVGALATRGATVGVFFTTIKFTQEAVDAAQRVQAEIALVDGLRLTELMIRHRVGVQMSRRIELIKIDDDFFGED